MAKRFEDMTEPEMRRHLGELSRLIMAVTPEGTLFALLLFDDSCIGQYASNAQRADMIKAMREFADRLERQEDIPR